VGSGELTLRERVRAVFRWEVPDCVPWFADLSWWHNAHQFRGTLPGEYQGIRGLVNLHRELNCGIYLQPIDPWRFRFDCRCRMQEHDNLKIISYETPHGTLRQVIQFNPEQYTFVFQEYLIKSSADLRAFRYLIESQIFEPDYTGIEEHQRIYGETGVVVVCLPRVPLSRLMVEMAGVETTCLLVMEEPDAFSDLLEIMIKSEESAYEIAAGAPAEFAMFPDNLSSDILSPQFFRRYSLEYYQHRCRQMKQSGKHTLVHIDGLLRGLLPLLGESRVDCAEAITPEPFGDVRAEELRSIASSDELILWGGVPGAMLVPEYPEDKFREHIIHYLQIMKQNPRFVLGIGDQLPPNGSLQRVKIVSELVEEYGKY